MPETLNDDDHEEIWVVILSTKGEYRLSKNQARLVQEAMARGERGAIVFKTFAISIPYVAEFYRESRFPKNTRTLPEGATESEYVLPSPEEMKKYRENIYKMIGKPVHQQKHDL